MLKSRAVSPSDKIFFPNIKETEISRSDKGNGEQQQGMWADLNTLLSVKLQCIRDAKQAGAGGTLFVQKGAETFTLQ